MARMIEPISSMLLFYSNSRRCFKKSWDHHFYDNLRILILSFDLRWLLKNIQGVLQSIPHSHLRNAPKFWKMAKNVQSISRRPLLAKKKFWPGSCYGKTSFKISNGKVGLVTYPWKDLPTTRIFLIYLSFFLLSSALNKSFH